MGSLFCFLMARGSCHIFPSQVCFIGLSFSGHCMFPDFIHVSRHVQMSDFSLLLQILNVSVSHLENSMCYHLRYLVFFLFVCY